MPTLHEARKAVMSPQMSHENHKFQTIN